MVGKALTIVFTTLILVSCSKNEDIKTVDIDLDGNEVLDIEDYFDMSIISLKSDSVMVGRADKVKIVDNLVFVLDRTYSKCVFVFNLEGVFLRKIGEIGKGGGEYINLKDFDILGNHIYLLSGMDRKILEFDFMGTLISEKHLASHGGYALKCFSDGTFATIVQSSLLSVYYWDKNGKKIDSFIMSDYSFISFNTPKPFSTFNDTTYIKVAYDSKIYHINSRKKINPAYLLDYGREAYPMSEINSKEQLKKLRASKKYIRTVAFVNNEKYILTVFSRKGIYRIGFYNKNDEHGKMMISVNQYYENIPIFKLIGEFNDNVIFSTEAYLVKQALRNKDTKYKELLDINENGNPILFILSPKHSILN